MRLFMFLSYAVRWLVAHMFSIVQSDRKRCALLPVLVASDRRSTSFPVRLKAGAARQTQNCTALLRFQMDTLSVTTFTRQPIILRFQVFIKVGNIRLNSAHDTASEPDVLQAQLGLGRPRSGSDKSRTKYSYCT